MSPREEEDRFRDIQERIARIQSRIDIPLANLGTACSTELAK